MNKFLTVFLTNFKNKVKAKSFIITTLLFSIIIAGVMNLDRIIELFNGEPNPVAFVIEDRELSTLVEDTYSSTTYSDHEHDIEYIDSKAAAETGVKDGKYDYAVIVESTSGEDLTAKYITVEDVHTEELIGIQSVLNSIYSFRKADELNISPENLQELTRTVGIDVENLSANLKDEKNHESSVFIVYVFIFLNYIMILVYASQLATAVTIEKSSRVTELVVSSISPAKYLFAQLLSTLLVGITQLLIWIAIPIILYHTALGTANIEILGNIDLTNIEISLIVYGVVYFILGFLLYGSLACLFGSLMSRAEEASQAVTPLMLLLLAAFYIAIYGISNPESTIINVSGYIPFFTPIIMLVRMAFINIPTVEIVITLIVLTISAIITVLITAQIYKGGVMLYGKGGFSNIKKALKLSKS
jgi:ABC-2 type transport system permease protein